MKIRFSAHGAYIHQYHIVWIPKYRKKVLKGELKTYLEKRLFEIQEYHPEIEVDTHGLTPVALKMRRQLKSHTAFGGFHPRPNVRGPQPEI